METHFCDFDIAVGPIDKVIVYEQQNHALEGSQMLKYDYIHETAL